MIDAGSSVTSGRVASLHLHPAEPGASLRTVDSFEVVTNKGIRGNDRYFGRVRRSTGQPSRRQVSLIAREQIGEHAAALGLATIPPGAVRANIETTGIDLAALLNQEIALGEAVLRVCEARTPCHRMDAICQGLRQLMENGCQGVLAEVLQSGQIHVGDEIRVLRTATPHSAVENPAS
jgi:MOSC domain-containing protein YiiM